MPNLSYFSHDNMIAQFGPNQTFAVLVDAPNPDGTGLVEPNEAWGYARQAIDFEATRSTSESGVTVLRNTNNVVFGPAVTADWPMVQWFAVFDENDNMIYYGRLRTARTTKLGEVTAFPIEDIEIRLR
ncbi:hypothetical protein CcrColossus_gp086 [Caulobacter phage CcrColossus]|uniref:Uncharacterized protein n=1 Tax=Caulobacter phage CcrColossus TaxID=1211640 RepID=K4JS78_9CAUD|nr:hypothetical protein CcrColossus_gp086 [Caulobacter phage CcrColossus]AFU87956.1 hypothetical protein CcrColossus_gp086 [Caulobacter phage CcrColossus]